MAEGDSGAWAWPATRRKTCSSRPGALAGAWYCFLIKPTSRTTCARSLSSFTIWPSMESMRCRDEISACVRSVLGWAKRAMAEEKIRRDRMDMNCIRRSLRRSRARGNKKVPVETEKELALGVQHCELGVPGIRLALRYAVPPYRKGSHHFQHSLSIGIVAELGIEHGDGRTAAHDKTRFAQLTR